MTRLLATWAGNVVALFVAAWLISGVSYGDEGWTLVLAGLVFTLANRIVKPVVTVLAIPLIVLTLGLGYVLVNLLMLYVTDWVVPDFTLRSFGAALLATLVVALTNAVLHLVFRRR
jgi:putative membrane protein